MLVSVTATAANPVGVVDRGIRFGGRDARRRLLLRHVLVEVPDNEPRLGAEATTGGQFLGHRHDVHEVVDLEHIGRELAQVLLQRGHHHRVVTARRVALQPLGREENRFSLPHDGDHRVQMRFGEFAFSGVFSCPLLPDPAEIFVATRKRAVDWDGFGADGELAPCDIHRDGRQARDSPEFQYPSFPAHRLKRRGRQHPEVSFLREADDDVVTHHTNGFDLGREGDSFSHGLGHRLRLDRGRKSFGFRGDVFDFLGQGRVGDPSNQDGSKAARQFVHGHVVFLS